MLCLVEFLTNSRSKRLSLILLSLWVVFLNIINMIKLNIYILLLVCIMIIRHLPAGIAELWR